MLKGYPVPLISRRRLLVLILSSCFLLFAVCAFAQTDPAVSGQWSGVMNWPSVNAGWVPTHVLLLPTGKVLYFSSYADGTTPRIWDPASNAVTDATLPGYNLFCSGHSHLSDGRLLITGGHIDDYVGYAHATI